MVEVIHTLPLVVFPMTAYTIRRVMLQEKDADSKNTTEKDADSKKTTEKDADSKKTMEKDADSKKTMEKDADSKKNCYNGITN